MGVEFRVLGRLEVDRDGRLLEVHRRRERCLLGVLLAGGEVVAVERLLAYVIYACWTGGSATDTSKPLLLWIRTAVRSDVTQSASRSSGW